jgi:ribosome-binding protein aMBF1 (putative translation factor)
MTVCNICSRRRAGFKTQVKVAPHKVKEMELCGICYKKYMKLREVYETKAYLELVELIDKGQIKND